MWQLDAKTRGLEVSHAALRLIAEIDEFKGKWEALRALSPKRLLVLRHVATVESVAASTRIDGLKLTTQEVETLLSNLQRYTFGNGPVRLSRIGRAEVLWQMA
jgi:hypothetical protein